MTTGVRGVLEKGLPTPFDARPYKRLVRRDPHVAIVTSALVQAMVYLAVAFAATKVYPHKGFKVAAVVLTAFCLTAPLRIVLGARVLIEAVSCLFGAAFLYVAIVVTVKAAGAVLGEETLALALFVPAFAGTFTIAILLRCVVGWRRRFNGKCVQPSDSPTR